MKAIFLFEKDLKKENDYDRITGIFQKNMKHFTKHFSLFDVVSTALVFAVLGAMLFVGTAHKANAGVLVQQAHADEYPLIKPEDRPEQLNDTDEIGTGEGLRATIVKVINVLLTFLGIIAVVLFIWAGFLMMTSAGNDEAVEKGKKTMIWAAIGIIVILFAYVLVNFIIGVGQGKVGG